MKLQKIVRVCGLFVLLALGALQLSAANVYAAPTTSETELLNHGAARNSFIAQPAPDAAQLLQFTAGEHVLGFDRNGVYIASTDHALRVEFVGGAGAAPLADTAAADRGRAQPLQGVSYANVWQGIDVRYEAVNGGIVKSSYIVASGADTSQIRLRYNTPVTLNANGILTAAFPTGQITETAPIAWQEIDGTRVPVQVSFRVSEKASEVSFTLGEYDHARPLVIDPALLWNTFMGSWGWDQGRGIAVDGSGNVYVVGSSAESWGSPVNAHTDYFDAFVAKLNSSGTLQWNTFMGSSGFDDGYGIAVDGSGNIYVVGKSEQSWGSPVNAYAGGYDAFTAKLSSLGTLQWNTFMGSSGSDVGYGIAVDASGNVYVVGNSPESWGSPVNIYAGELDAFAVKLSSSGTLQWNTFMGGELHDHGNGIAVDGSGNVYVVGDSEAAWGSPVNAYAGEIDAFAVKLSSSGSLQWNTFMGSSDHDYGYGIAVDGSGNIYVVGKSKNSWGSPMNAYAGGDDAFTVKLNSSGTLQWNTFMGSSGWDEGRGIAIDGSKKIAVVGGSLYNWGSPVNPHAGGWSDAFAAELNDKGTLQWHTFMGSSDYEDGYGIALDSKGNPYVAGSGYLSWGLPVNAHAGGKDAFVAKVKAECIGKPAKPTLGLPAKNGSVKKPKVNLKWNDVSCETEYRVTVKNAATNQTVFQTTLSADVTQLKTTKLAKGQTYKWYVQACNEIGCTKSATWKFSIKP